MAEQLISTADHADLPDNYVRPESQQRPLRLSEVVPDAQIPVIDLADPDGAAVVGDACRTHGFFQVLNHGMPAELTRAMLAVAYDFFRLPADEKAKLYSDDPAKKMRLSTSFNVRKETVHNWRDYLRLHCHPLQQHVPADWPENPPSFREVVTTYCRVVRELGQRLYGAISERLRLDDLKGGYKERRVLGEQEQRMAVNFDPRCPGPPELTCGLPAAALLDPNAPAVLLGDQLVAAGGGQPVRRVHGRWTDVNPPRPDALVINIGDQLAALSVVAPHVDQPPVPVRGGGGGGHVVGVGGHLGPAAIALAVAGLTGGGAVNPSTAVPLLLTLIAGVVLLTVRVARA